MDGMLKDHEPADVFVYVFKDHVVNELVAPMVVPAALTALQR
jgi:hypothetical protein